MSHACVCFLPGGPGDGDAVGGVHVEGEHVVDQPGLLHRRRAAAALRRRVEVGVERAAVELHQIQDGRRQLLHHFVCQTRNFNFRLYGVTVNETGSNLPPEI